MSADLQHYESSYGLYVYLMAMVTSLFDSKQIYEDTLYYYN